MGLADNHLICDNLFWTRQGAEDFLVPASRGKGHAQLHGEILIQMGDWYSGKLIPKLNETAALVKESITENLDEKISFSRLGVGFFA